MDREASAAAGMAWEHRAVWVTGLMRSGTTLLLSLLDGHPRLLVYPVEPSFNRLFSRPHRSPEELVTDWLYGTPNELHPGVALENAGKHPPHFDPRGDQPFPIEFAPDPALQQALIRGIRISGLEPDDQAQRIDVALYHSALDERMSCRDRLGPREVVVDSMRALAMATRRTDPISCWLFKQPMANLRAQRLAWFFDGFREGRCIVIVRDPRGHFNSSGRYGIRKHRGRTDWGTRPRLLRELEKLERSYGELAEIPRRYGHERVRFVYYEDLLSDVEGEMRGLAQFLGIDFDPILGMPTRLGRRWRVVTGRAEQGASVAPATGTAWKQELSGLEIAAIQRALAGFYRIQRQRYALQPASPADRLAVARLFAGRAWDRCARGLRRSYRRGRRLWRAPYLRARRTARRLLESAGLLAPRDSRAAR